MGILIGFLHHKDYESRVKMGCVEILLCCMESDGYVWWMKNNSTIETFNPWGGQTEGYPPEV